MKKVCPHVGKIDFKMDALLIMYIRCKKNDGQWKETAVREKLTDV